MLYPSFISAIMVLITDSNNSKMCPKEGRTKKYTLAGLKYYQVQQNNSLPYIYAENFATLEILAISRDVVEISKEVRPTDLEDTTITGVGNTGSPPVEVKASRAKVLSGTIK